MADEFGAASQNLSLRVPQKIGEVGGTDFGPESLFVGTGRLRRLPSCCHTEGLAQSLHVLALFLARKSSLI